MKKRLIFGMLFSLVLSITGYAQTKKVAVVTFYAVKKIGVADFGATANAAVTQLVDDPDFNMSPLLQNFHDQFFNTYAKDFTFQLLPEAEVTGNTDYKAYAPAGEATSGVFKDNYNLPYDGYKIILPLAGKQNEKALLKIFNQADGIMKVYIDFDLVKIGFGGMGVVKVKANCNIAMYNKAGDKVFSVSTDARSKGSSPLIAGVPVLKTDKILPMCESALAELMTNLQKDMPKMIKKAEAKL
ncbi:hypothetical protein [Mucilaginibacter phyllosphaerae]|uniref:Uncharacterized protein n=1 Tax=Mucilaginibacter phyllosphaerae TaxID=1812349 RepID=A0A4Y8AEP5_9SPHI|nr:hypothetical protein [Mucilaginibacter phyllosphaerae]MBB3970275.1 hypothetical protein [Mucilaginibacter phyllosphaerae]TEW66652.1 hypothetical protein E2R65_09525 [Mucilaginibacter phyllosphaerae]GGH10977.1 hypothetical protein GCM10007352_17010 [Mucilaginibacter phyllosphaerae]